MRRLLFLISVIFLLLIIDGCNFSGTDTAQDENEEESTNTEPSPTPPSATPVPIDYGWSLPPTGTVTREYPRLINYYHFSTNETPANYRSQRLAQWDIVVIFPYKAESEQLSFETMRNLNPDIKILAWIPLGQAPDPSFPFGDGIPDIDSENWFLKDTAGEYVTFGAPYYEHIMNPYKTAHAWPEYIIDFVVANYLDDTEENYYDGVFLDCMWTNPPVWLYENSAENVDVDEDGDYDADDIACWREGISAVLSGIKSEAPGKIVTGNNGVPLGSDSTYWPLIDGCYHENALGSEFGDPCWTGSPIATWDGYQTAMSKGAPYYMIGVDVRTGDSESFDVASVKKILTEDDLRRMRLGLGTALLGDGYFGFDSGDCIHGQLWWFNEYNVDLGTPLGDYTINSNLYMREFTNGLVLVNPTTTPISISLPDTYLDATSRKNVQTVIIPAVDARILSVIQ